MNKFLSDYLEDKLSVSKFPIFWDKPNNCEDFIVEEITNDGHLIELNKRYQKQDSAIPNKKFHLHFAMQKTNWSTNDALRAITRQLRIGKKRYSYAGTKDKHAISTQVASLFAVRKQDMERLRIKDITILGMWYENDKIRMGMVNKVKEFVEKAFEIVDLNWQEYVKVDKRFMRPQDVNYLRGDYSKAKEKLEWKPGTKFDKLVEVMVKEDLNRWKRWLNGERFPWDAPNYPNEAKIITRTLRV